MSTFLKRHGRSLACGSLIVAASAFVIPALADDMMAPKDGMMMAEPMKMMKDGMKDDASKMQMTTDLAKMMVMQHMAMQMCEGGKCQKMVEADPDLKKMSDDAMKMATDAGQMKMLADQIKNDPAAMRQVMMMSMAHDAMMKDKPMGGMGGGMMHDDKMMKH